MERSRKITNIISAILLISIATGLAGATASISGHVYVYHAPNATNTVLTKEMTFNKTTQEFESNQIYYFATEFTHIHVFPNFFYFSCEGGAGDCAGREPMGGEVYVDDYQADGLQVQLEVHTPWDTWDNPVVDNKAFLEYTYSGGDPTWQGDTYTVYVSTFTGASGNSGATIETQLVTANHYDTNSFVKPYCIGISSLCGIADGATLTNGGGSLNYNRTTQAIYVNTTGIPDTTNITSYSVKVLAELLVPSNGGFINIYQPINYPFYPQIERLVPPLIPHVYFSIPNGVVGKQWYEIDSFTSSLQDSPIFTISMIGNVKIYETQLIVNYNSSSTAATEIPLENIEVSLNTANTVTNADGLYSLPFPDNGTYDVTFIGFHAKKQGLSFYGEGKNVPFTGSTTGDDVWLNESVNPMTGQILFVGNSTFIVGQQMNISYNLYHPDRLNNTFSIDIYTPTADFSQDMIFDTKILLSNDSGYWLPDGDKVTMGLRKLYLNYTANTGGTPDTLADLSGVYGTTEPNGTISVDKHSYNLTETAVITYNSTVNGRIVITCPECNDFNVSFPIVYGTNQTLNFSINSPMQYGQYFAWLQYNVFGVNWNVIAMTPFSVVPNASFVSFDQDSYGLGMSIQARIFQISNGYMLLKYPNSSIIANYTNMSVNNFSYNVYFTLFTDPTGIWTAELYNSTGSLVATATTTVFSTVVTPPATPTPTPQPITTCPSGVCSGVAWQAGDTYTWLAINIPILIQVVYIIIILSVVSAVAVLVGGKRKR